MSWSPVRSIPARLPREVLWSLVCFWSWKLLVVSLLLLLVVSSWLSFWIPVFQLLACGFLLAKLLDSRYSAVSLWFPPWLSFWIPFFQLLAFLQMNKLFGGIYREHSPLPPGFVNKHNCCYANSTIQCVMNTPSITWLCRCLDAVHANCKECLIEGIKCIHQWILPVTRSWSWGRGRI